MTSKVEITPGNEMTVITNNVPRFTIEAYELTPKEQAEFDYLDWKAIEEGSDSATFFRYKGTLYDLGEFQVCPFQGWDGFQSDTFFSATLVRYVDNGESVIVGRCYS